MRIEQVAKGDRLTVGELREFLSAVLLHTRPDKVDRLLFQSEWDPHAGGISEISVEIDGPDQRADTSAWTDSRKKRTP